MANQRPGKIVCIGRNYREHAKELGNEVPTEPLFFLKPPSSIIGEGEAIMLPEQSQQVEFEGEIGVLIGSTLTRASATEAENAVAGVLAVNDVTARDLQKKDSQWTRAKGFDTVLSSWSGVNRAARSRQSHGRDARERRREAARIELGDGFFHRNAALIRITCNDTGAGRYRRDRNAVRASDPLAPGDVVEVEVVGVSKVSNPVEARA